MDRELRNLRREVDEIERGRGRWYPHALRERIGRWCRVRRTDGASLRVLAAEIGVSPESLRRWSASAAIDAPTLRAVEIVADPETAGGERAVRIVTPAGFRIEGLTIADAIALVRVLG